MDLVKFRPPTCDVLCVNPFHRLKSRFGLDIPPDKMKLLLTEIRNFLPKAQSEDDVYDEFLLRGHGEDDITLALEKLHDNPHP